MTQDIPIMKTASEFPAELGRISAIPRTRLFAGPTPLEAMPNLARSCGGGTFVVKRDDCMGLAFGGNKVRQLEFYIGEAQAQNADTVLITGAVQSNFVRLAAAAARKSGMDCHVQLEERVTKSDAAYRNSGNVLIDRLLGATLHSYPDGEDEAGADKRLGEIADGLRQSGRRPYVIPLAPGHPPLGALGYVVAAHELARQIADTGLEIDEIVVASGSGNTHAGLLFGLRALGSGIPVTRRYQRQRYFPAARLRRCWRGDVARHPSCRPHRSADPRSDLYRQGDGRLHPPGEGGRRDRCAPLHPYRWHTGDLCL
jgi:D-cysteine desulfhydrase/L-cysteate sulfo-lyase